MNAFKPIALTLSLAATMTGAATWLLIAATVVWEELGPRWLGDDDGLWLALPIGAAAGLGVGIRFRRSAWVHVVGPGSVALLVFAIVAALARETPEGMQGLGIALGKLLAVGLALLAAGTGAVSLLVASVAVFLLGRRARGVDDDAKGAGSGGPRPARP